MMQSSRSSLRNSRRSRMDETDDRLVERTLAGEAGAFDVLVRRNRSDLVRCIGSLIGDADEAESLAQETLTRAFAPLAPFRPGERLPAWPQGLARTLCGTHRRRRAHHARPGGPEDLADAADPVGQRQGVLSGILRAEIGDRTLQAIQQLPPPLREAFLLHFVEGLDYAAMGEQTVVEAGERYVRGHTAHAAGMGRR